MNREAPTVAIDLGDIKKDGSVTLSLTYVLIHASAPLPARIEQKDAQYLIWKSNSTYVDSWYPSDVERIKIRQVTSPCASSNRADKQVSITQDSIYRNSPQDLHPRLGPH